MDDALEFEHQAAWARWLDLEHKASAGVWLKHAKKGSPRGTVTYQEALEVAICFGWIDGQKRALDEHFWLQRWCPRGKKSLWSKVNREKALSYIEQGKMQTAGLVEVQRAQEDGRWDAAYDSSSKATVPPDLEEAFKRHPGAAEFFATLKSANRYAVLFRVQTARKPETRARKIEEYAAMLARGEAIHPII